MGKSVQHSSGSEKNLSGIRLAADYVLAKDVTRVRFSHAVPFYAGDPEWSQSLLSTDARSIFTRTIFGKTKSTTLKLLLQLFYFSCSKFGFAR